MSERQPVGTTNPDRCGSAPPPAKAGRARDRRVTPGIRAA